MSEDSIGTKVCNACGEEKPLTEFYLHPETHDGYYNKCKYCHVRNVPAVPRASRISEDGTERECCRCGVVKPIENFARNGGNRRNPACKDCVNAGRRNDSAEKRGPVVKDEREKTCSRCHATRSLSDFRVAA